MKLLNKAFFNRPTHLVAQDLLGKRLIRIWRGQRISGIIIETEAYQSDDPACHAFRGMTERNKALFGPVGHSYVYFIYGNHYCVNIVARAEDLPAGGVLIRALIPDEGIEIMKKARGTQRIQDLTNGPGKLTQALHITRAQEGIDMTKEGALFIELGITVPASAIVATPRIGISCGTDTLWRFMVEKK